MAKHLGRKVILSRDGEPIANLRTKELSIDGEPADITDDDSSGWHEVLDEPGEINVTMSVSGVLANDTLRAEAFSTSRIKGDELSYPDGGSVEGDFFLQSYSESHEYNEASTFDAELLGSGEMTYTDASE